MRGMIANVITSCRIILSLIMLPLPVFSTGFYACYLLAGVTDMVDGTIAHKLGADSEFGEKLDTIADIIFVAIAAYKMLPAFKLSLAIWIWIGVIAVIKVINIISGFVVQKKMVAVHSWANRITGLALFVLPFTLCVIDIRCSVIAVCLLATFAAIHEYHFVRKV